MHRSTARMLVFLLITVILGGSVVFDAWRKQGKADDILSMTGVNVCATKRDFNAGKHHCPDSKQVIITCDEARAAVANLADIKLLSEVAQSLPPSSSSPAECELKTVSESEGLYALIVHAYYPTPTGTGQALNSSAIRSEASSKLYGAYTNFYQSYFSLDLATPSARLGIPQIISFHSFTPAFLVHGEPGFRMNVKLEDEGGAQRAGAGILIKVFCGEAQDYMVAEPDGNSWFSFSGYERLNCGNQPLQAQAVVQRDRNGQWTKGTSSYSYDFENNSPLALIVQNRPQPAQANFLGKWQGLGALVQVQSQNVHGDVALTPLPKTTVIFDCNQDRVLTSPITRTTDSQGRATIGLADAQKAFLNCQQNQFEITLSNYDAQTGASSKDDPTYDYYFASPGPALAGQVSGRTLTHGVIQGQELTVGGTVRLADIGAVSGGIFAEGSQVCFFYSLTTAKATSGCPTDRTATTIPIHVDTNGQYVFGGTPLARISYGDYLKAGAGKAEVRIVNYQNKSYGSGVVTKNDLSLTHDFNLKDIILPTTDADLHDHICQAALYTWSDSTQCEPAVYIAMRESRLDPSAVNTSSGACGMFQFLPCTKYQTTALPGEDYHAVGNQIRAGMGYIEGRYITAVKAKEFWDKNNYY
jgi:hypothetical protein